MRKNEIDTLGKTLFPRPVLSYTPRERKGVMIFGLNTTYQEFEDRNELISWQLSLDKEHTKLFTTPLNWDNLDKESRLFLKENDYKLSDYNQFVYGVYFSPDGCQWLDWIASEVEIYGTHRINLRFSDSLKHSHQHTHKHKNGTFTTHTHKHTHRKTRALYIYDVANWFIGQGLNGVCNTFKLQKLTYKLTDFTPDCLNDPDFVDYAKNEAYITGEVLKRLRQRELAESGVDIILTRTPATTAGADFRAKYVTEELAPPYSTLRKRAIQASWGAVKECYYRGDKQYVYEVDGKSFYPNCAIQMGILPLAEDWQITASLDKWLSAKGGFGTVKFEFPDDCKYPCLPVGVGTRQYRPLKGISHCSTFEVELALEMKAKVVLLKGYYYNTGVTWMADYQKELLAKRDATDDPVLDTLYKLKSNSIIGKLTQKMLNYDTNDLVEYAKEHDLPIEVAMNIKPLPLVEKLSTGNCFIPEWNTLILGKARAIIMKLSWQHNVLQTMTDAVIVERYEGKSFMFEGIKFELKCRGSYTAYRSGLYRIGEKYVHQSIEGKASKSILDQLLEQDILTYKTERTVSLKQTINTGARFGMKYMLEQDVSLAYDHKRKLLDNGDTMPYSSDEYISIHLDTIEVNPESFVESIRQLEVLASEKPSSRT